MQKYIIRSQQDADTAPIVPSNDPIRPKEKFYPADNMFGGKGLKLKVWHSPKLLVQPDGSHGHTMRMWCYIYTTAGKQYKYQIGDLRCLSYMQAQKIHLDCYMEVKAGVNIVVERRAKEAKNAAKPTGRIFKTVSDLWLVDKEKTLSNHSYYMTVSRLNTHVLPALGKLRTTEITRQHIVKMRDKVLAKSPSMASAAITIAKQILDYAADAGWAESNVAADVKPKFKAGRRKWHFSDDEISRIWAGLDASNYSWQTIAIVKLLICLGSRRQEMVGLRKDEITLDDMGGALILLPPERTKTKIDFQIYVGKELCDKVLKPAIEKSGDSPFVFPSPYSGRAQYNTITPQNVSKSFGELLKNLGIEGVLHTTRASLLSGCMQLGLDGQIADSLLGHMPAGTMAIYMKSFNLPKQMAVWQAWQNHVFNTVEGKVKIRSEAEKALHLLKG